MIYKKEEGIKNMRKNHIAFIDFEMNTNGDMDKNDLEIIEYAFIKYDINTGEEVARCIGFTRPISVNHIFSFATYLTGITDDKLDNASTFKDMLDRYTWFTKDCQKIYYWGDIDKLCLINSIVKMDIRYSYPIKQTLKKMHNFQQEVKGAHSPRHNTSLLNVAKQLDLLDDKAKQEHRATPDAELLAKVYFAIR